MKFETIVIEKRYTGAKFIVEETNLRTGDVIKHGHYNRIIMFTIINERNEQGYDIKCMDISHDMPLLVCMSRPIDEDSKDLKPLSEFPKEILEHFKEKQELNAKERIIKIPDGKPGYGENYIYERYANIEFLTPGSYINNKTHKGEILSIKGDSMLYREKLDNEIHRVSIDKVKDDICPF